MFTKTPILTHAFKQKAKTTKNVKLGKRDNLGIGEEQRISLVKIGKIEN
jgi:hypothetical protein